MVVDPFLSKQPDLNRNQELCLCAGSILGWITCNCTWQCGASHSDTRRQRWVESYWRRLMEFVEELRRAVLKMQKTIKPRFFLAARYRGHWPAGICRTTNEPQFEVCEVCEANIGIPCFWSIEFKVIKSVYWGYSILSSKCFDLGAHWGALSKMWCVWTQQDPQGLFIIYIYIHEDSIYLVFLCRSSKACHISYSIQRNGMGSTSVGCDRLQIWCLLMRLFRFPSIHLRTAALTPSPEPTTKQLGSDCFIFSSHRRKVKHAIYIYIIIWIYLNPPCPLLSAFTPKSPNPTIHSILYILWHPLPLRYGFYLHVHGHPAAVIYQVRVASLNEGGIHFFVVLKTVCWLFWHTIP